VHLCGTVGTGKTHLACAVVRGLTSNRRINSAMFLYVPKFLSDLRDSFDLPMQERRDWLDRVMTCDLLVLDDLGAEKTSEWVREQLGIIINERWGNRRSVIVTSNLTLDNYRSTLGERAASRLAAMCPFVFEITGSDQRAPK
jgi:DNA replication protein DnaC